MLSMLGIETTVSLIREKLEGEGVFNSLTNEWLLLIKASSLEQQTSVSVF